MTKTPSVIISSNSIEKITDKIPLALKILVLKLGKVNKTNVFINQQNQSNTT